MIKQNITNPQELQLYMQGIDYGYVDLSGIKNTIISNDFSDQYRLQSLQDIETNQIGICWDQVELERLYFKQMGLKFQTFCIIYYEKEKYPNHTFLIYYDHNKVYWFESAFIKYSGIHEYDDIESLICDIRNKFICSLKQKCIDEDNLCLYEYSAPKIGITCNEFYKHVEQHGPLKLLWAKK